MLRHPRSARRVLLVLSLTLACSGKGDTPAASEDGAEATNAEGGTPLFNPDPSPPAPKNLIPPLLGSPVGPQPGWIEGAFFLASWETGTMQEFAQSLPLSPMAARDLAEFGSLLGADPRVDDVLAHLGIDPKARSSLSVRPLVDHASAIKTSVDAGGAMLDELAWRDEPGRPERSAEAQRLIEQVDSLGVHMRWHVPIADPSKAISLRNSMKSASMERWPTTCADFANALMCTGGSDVFLLARELPGAIQIDAFGFFTSIGPQADSPTRRAIIQTAVAMPGGRASPAAAGLRGNANLLVASTPTFTAMRASEMARAISSMAWEGRDALAQHAKRDAAMWAIHEPERLFEGIKLEVDLSKQRIHAGFGWLPTAAGKQLLPRTFDLLQVDADLPTLAALCQDSLACGRSRGMPSLARFESLATGVFADPDQFLRTMEEGDDDLMLVLLMLESWPNALGSAAKFPGQSMRPPESTVAENSKKAAERVLGFGFALRSLEVTEDRIAMQWIGFSRMPAMDLSTLRGGIRMMMEGLAPVTIEGVPGSVEVMRIEEDDFPISFYSITDPEVATGSWGWAVAADSDERVRWMIGLPRDDGSAPLAYGEIADLWRLLGGARDLATEFGYAQAWLSGRSARGQWSLGVDGPQLHVLVEASGR